MSTKPRYLGEIDKMIRPPYGQEPLSLVGADAAWSSENTSVNSAGWCKQPEAFDETTSLQASRPCASRRDPRGDATGAPRNSPTKLVVDPADPTGEMLPLGVAQGPPRRVGSYPFAPR